MPIDEGPTAYEAAYCPRCGTETGEKHVDGRDRTWCPECDVVHWRAAVPVVGVAVVDPGAGDEPGRVLAFHHDRTGRWDLPSGHQELPESAPETAARELAEETNLAVDPDALDVLDVTVKEHPRLGRYNFSTTYRTTRAATTGTPEPERPGDALRWFSPAEARDAADEFVPGTVDVVERAVAALE